MNKSTLITLSILMSIVILAAALIYKNYLRWPAVYLHEYVLWHTPIGTDIEDVISHIESRKNWRIRHINRERGFLRPGRAVPGWPIYQSSGQNIVGEKSIRVFAGNYQAWYKINRITWVDIFWGFDKDGKLVEIYVWKSIDAM